MLNRLSMIVPKGSIYDFAEKNGTGKTTLIRIICGLQEPTSGEYSILVIKNNQKEIVKSCRRMGAVVETPSIYTDMTAEDNLRVQSRVLGLPSYICQRKNVCVTIKMMSFIFKFALMGIIPAQKENLEKMCDAKKQIQSGLHRHSFKVSYR